MPNTCPPCTHDCNQGRNCPARRLTAAIAILLLLTACSETTTEWNYNDAIFLGAGDSAHGAPSAGFDDPSGVVGVDSPSGGDDAADPDAGAGDDDGGSHGDVGKGHDHGDDSDDGDHDDGDDD